MVVRPLIGTASARFGRRRVLLSAVLAAAVALGVTPFMSQLWTLGAWVIGRASESAAFA